MSIISINYDNFIFDLDGTIINSSQEILLCLKKAFQKSNYTIDESKFTPDIIGPPVKEIIKKIAPELEDEIIISEIIKNFRQIYDYDDNDISILYNGIYNYLIKLKEQNKKLFIATFKPSVPTFKLLKKFKLNMFDDIYTVDKFNKPIKKTTMIADIIDKYNLKKDKTVMIGDAISDMLAAKENNIKSIAVMWGYETNKNKLNEHADFFIRTTEDLL